jgi:hypothetical protein
MTSNLDQAAASFESWMTAGSIRGNVDVVKFYLNKATEEIALAIRKNDADGAHLDNLKALAASLEQVKETSVAVSEEWIGISDDRLADYKVICDSMKS